MSKPKFTGRQIELDGKKGKIIYANSSEVLIEFPDKTRTRVSKDYARFLLDLDEYKLPGES